ncbi:WW domain [Macleaya cordata]|uniref:WW domain n=1 Tax=Macleaya cordata TaxID=56857 RepID=A0A200PU09_MACCD|nr:WW domain [Macleaya cordata]
MELQQQKQREENENKVKKSQQLWRVMDDTELSLAPSQVVTNTQSMNCSSSESEADSSKKRKYYWDHFKTEPSLIKTSIELQHKDPLPVDWEQCLDLESGRMYYLNRKTLRRSWNWPKEQKLDLELNMSTLTSSDGSNSSSEMLVGSKKHNSSSSNNMFAVACLKCHLLVMLCKSSPSCPNCKYVNPLPTQQSPRPKTFNTLSLLK